MMESKVPQGIKESLDFSSVSTDRTDARQILFDTLETLAEPDNPARDLLASALKVLNKALHTINEEVSSVAVQEPSDALGCEGVVTESPCDAVATQETPNVVTGVVTESPCDAVATQETSNVVDGGVTESPSDVVCEGSEIIASTCNVSVVSGPLIKVQAFSEENINLNLERGSSIFGHESAKSFTKDGIMNIHGSEINASIQDVSAASAFGESTKVERTFSNTSLRSRKRRGSSVNSIESCAHRSRDCSEVWEPVRKSRRFSESPCDFVGTQEPPDVDDGVVTKTPCDAAATQETPDIDNGVVMESPCDAVATQETPHIDEGLLTESPCDTVAPQETPAIDAGVVTESPCDAVATQETPGIDDGVVTESLCDAVATQETSDIDNGVVTESPCDAVATQESPDVDAGVVTESPCDAVATQETPDIDDGVVTESPCDAVATQETSDIDAGVATESPCDAVATHQTPEDKTTNIDDVSAASTVTEFSDVEGSFSNKSFRSRKRRSSSENSIESCIHRNRNCSEIREPLRKSRRLSENTACLCQRESSEPDEVNATDETMASSEETRTLPMQKLPSLDPPQLTKGVTGEETTAINKSEITTSTCNVAAASEPAAAEEAYSEHDGTVPMKKRIYMDLRELTAGVDEDDATVIAALGITSSSCNFTVASELATTEEAYSEHDGTVPMKKRTYMDLRELTAGVDEDDTTVIAAIGITSSSCNLTVASELATAEEKLSGINITLPLERCSALDVHESSEVLRTEESTNVYESDITASGHNVITGRDLFITADDYFEGNTSVSVDKVSLVDEAVHAEVISMDGTTSKDEVEIAASLNDGSVAPQGFLGDDGSAEDVEKVSSLDVLKSADAIATDATPVTDESEVTSSIHGVSAASEDLVVGEKPSEAYVTLPVEKLSLLEVHHGPVEVVATGETVNLDEVEITGCAYDGSVITAEKGLSEDTTFPVEDITSPEVHQPTMSVTADEITSLEGNKIAESICDVALAVQRHFQDTTALPGERVSSLDVHEPANAVATNETTTPDDIEGSLSSRALRLRKRKRAAETANEVSGHASTSCSVHQDLGAPVRKSKRCLLNSGVETPASTSMATIAPVALTEGPEAATTETAVNDTIKIKAEGIPAPNSGAESPDTMEYVHYYLSTAYELLYNAMKRDPAGTLPVESIIQQPQEPNAVGPSQNNRARRRRVRRVWNGEAFVPEVQTRDHAEPHLRRRPPRRK